MQVVLDGRYHAGARVVALGMFDGVHIGHRVLLQKGRALGEPPERSAGGMYIYGTSAYPDRAGKMSAAADYL